MHLVIQHRNTSILWSMYVLSKNNCKYLPIPQSHPPVSMNTFLISLVPSSAWYHHRPGTIIGLVPSSAWYSVVTNCRNHFTLEMLCHSLFLIILKALSRFVSKFDHAHPMSAYDSVDGTYGSLTTSAAFRLTEELAEKMSSA